MSEALRRLAASTADAVAGVLSLYAPDEVRAGEPRLADGPQPILAIPLPAVVTSVSYVNGVTGGNLFAISLPGARRLAAAMMGEPPAPEVPANAELSELEGSAIGEAMNQMMAAAAAATGEVLGQDVEIAPPEIRTVATRDQALELYEPVPSVTAVSFSVLGGTCHLIQLVPKAFTVRMSRALDNLGAEMAVEDVGGPRAASSGTRHVLRSVPLRVCVELGRTRMPIGQAVGLAPGEIVELDRAAEEPVEIVVNGRCLALGRLLLVDGTDWAVRIDELRPAAR